MTRARLHTAGHCGCLDYTLFTGNRKMTASLLDVCGRHTDRVMVRCFFVGCNGSMFEIEGSRWFLQFVLKALCTRSQFLLFMLLRLLYSLLQELRRVLHYAIMMLLTFTILQGIVLEVGGRDVVVFGIASQVINVTFFLSILASRGSTLNRNRMSHLQSSTTSPRVSKNITNPQSQYPAPS